MTGVLASKGIVARVAGTQNKDTAELRDVSGPFALAFGQVRMVLEP